MAVTWGSISPAPSIDDADVSSSPLMTISQLGGVTYARKRVLFSKSDRKEQKQLNKILKKTLSHHSQRVVSQVRSEEVQLMARLAQEYTRPPQTVKAGDWYRTLARPSSSQQIRVKSPASSSRPRTSGGWSPSFKLDESLSAPIAPLPPLVNVTKVFDASTQRWVARAPSDSVAQAAVVVAATAQKYRDKRDNTEHIYPEN